MKRSIKERVVHPCRGFVLTSNLPTPMKTLLTALVLILANSAHAQTAPPQNPTGQGGQQQSQGQADEPTRDGLWDGRFSGGNYIVRCNSIIALSKHEYISDGVARVVEVNLTLNSAQVVRFYFLEAVQAGNRQQHGRRGHGGAGAGEGHV
jgi:hypothetical protein